jgi:hypothetical protein
MLLVAVTADGEGDCLHVDNAGRVRHRFYPIDDLLPLWRSLQPRSTWPEITNLDVAAIEREERAAAADRMRKLRAARKARKSPKVKRGGRAA